MWGDIPEEADHAVAEAKEEEGVGEGDGREDADARDDGERVGGGVVVQDEAGRGRAKGEEAGRPH